MSGDIIITLYMPQCHNQPSIPLNHISMQDAMMVVCTLSRVTLVPHTGASSLEDPHSQSSPLRVSIHSPASSGLAPTTITSTLSTFMLVHDDIMSWCVIIYYVVYKARHLKWLALHVHGLHTYTCTWPEEWPRLPPRPINLESLKLWWLPQ